ncbi:GGDEF domain-containing protein [Pelagibaculum spongiae]|uniref:diguanylate cyclase n=1 Tax=Pelagibaculum spongiae TaxID=2080658 RepID=A0A2V1GT70_9GAMM|nr:GGDEF domain-containing protein [Pelagibaculum spongiae]PVZ68214.1 GGDEF domain-containing protein [Pelagibaculum spongiae]
MDSFCWNEQFTTGLDEVDFQHKNLVDLINSYGAHLKENDLSAEFIEQVFQQLFEYAQYHFTDEEQSMLSKGVDSRHCDKHILEHHGFLVDVKAFYQLTSLDNREELQQLLDFLTHWLAYHILGMDQNMSRQIKAISQGMSPDDAYQAEEKKTNNATEPLLAALNALFRQVSARNMELTLLNKSLEEKIQERTKELADAYEQLKEIAMTDELTGLPNRRYAIRRSSELWRESTVSSTPLFCMMIDVDHFKQVNDTFGHDAGDKVLRQLSRVLKHALRTDDLVCRLGGDEFMVLCPNTDAEGGLYLAQNLHQKVKDFSIELADDEIGTCHWKGSTSIGVAERDRNMISFEDLIKAADKKVYLAKEQGKNCIQGVHLKTA